MKRILPIFILMGCVALPCADGQIGVEYLGTAYVSDPLGEMRAPDTDPLIRFDAFDCTTFVETALAGGDVDKLTRIRYKDGNIDFLNRNHFIETDWIKNNSELVKNVSAEYGTTAIRHVDIDKRGWLKKVHRMDSTFPVQSADLDYIPYANLTRIGNKEPLIVLFITGKSEKSAKIGTDLAVVHMGFLLPGGVLRHASQIEGRIVDTDFYEYAKLRQSRPNDMGVTLLEIRQ